MRRAAAALLLALAFVPGLPVGGAREKPGDARFDVADRVEELRLPISARPVTISLWAPLPPGAGVENLSQLLIYREASRRTGVTVAFVHSLPVPPAVLRCGRGEKDPALSDQDRQASPRIGSRLLELKPPFPFDQVSDSRKPGESVSPSPGEEPFSLLQERIKGSIHPADRGVVGLRRVRIGLGRDHGEKENVEEGMGLAFPAKRSRTPVDPTDNFYYHLLSSHIWCQKTGQAKVLIGS